jgi:DNA-binding winged helix-turn-helix (wHTH) protein
MTEIVIGDLSIDTERRIVRCGERSNKTEPRICELLQAFTQHPNAVLHSDRLLRMIYGSYEDDVTSGALRTIIKRLRRLLEELGSSCRIEVHNRAGYEFVVSGPRSQMLSFSDKQMMVFRRILDIAARTRPDLVAIIQGDYRAGVIQG